MHSEAGPCREGKDPLRLWLDPAYRRREVRASTSLLRLRRWVSM